LLEFCKALLIWKLLPFVSTSVKISHVHLALILDGNRRWAKARFLPKQLGHQQGIANLKKILKVCASDQRIKIVTAYALSTENLKREQSELANLFELINKFVQDQQGFIAAGIQVRPIGDLSVFSQEIQTNLAKLQKATFNCGELIFQPALHYGGQDEIVRAVNKLIAKGKTKLKAEDIALALDTGDLPQVDLLIRTGGKRRLSNFLLWQAAYAELYFTEKMWPEFDPKELAKALEFFESVQRNFGA
jgi:undecaprenyl diphosphate synthase